jgi:solute:Na+ symporter, SSS family
MKLNFPAIAAKEAFPIFVLNHMPPLLGGVVMATLLISVVGTGAGLALGTGSIISNDIIPKLTRRLDNPKTYLLVNRSLIVAILATGVCCTGGSLGDIILDFGFMSMGLRAAVVFVPLCAALFWKGRIGSGFINAAIVAGPVSVLVGSFFIKSFDPLFTGIAASLLIVSAGVALKQKG